ncbi:hypothetical protein PsW64_00990 [Pseudovibrio sp. W64]|nr:hypothetical protein PsAD13_05291 [Pseudovibrio sp. Ad13]KZK87693.1 hypothetical protein PsW64_00990 [Pseudovibrio sp. W64]KZK90916.1 hypothetical protein PsAD5_04054 [Pseudovibrio sp. Ad5]KZL12944.1 hypothetical protein PsAD26_02522 [Pseudovibrio sp. Ad26]
MSRSVLVLQYRNKKSLAWFTQDVRLAYDFPNVCV